MKIHVTETNKLNQYSTEDRLEFLVKRATNKTVIHIGCTGGLIDESADTEWASQVCDTIHYKLANVASDMVGVDINKERLKKLQLLCNIGSYIEMDITKPISLELHMGKYDIILFPEIIEHLDCPGVALENLKKFMDKESVIILTTPNAFSLGNIFRILLGCEKNHPEHISQYSYITIFNLALRHGLNVKEFYYYKEARRGKQFFIYAFQSIMLKIFPQLSPGIVFVLSLDERH